MQRIPDMEFTCYRPPGSRLYSRHSRFTSSFHFGIAANINLM